MQSTKVWDNLSKEKLIAKMKIRILMQMQILSIITVSTTIKLTTCMNQKNKLITDMKFKRNLEKVHLALSLDALITNSKKLSL